MDSTWQRMASDLFGRLDGPMHLRFFMQPAMAVFFGIRDGITDARENQPAYFQTIFTDPAQRKELLAKGLKAVGKILLFALLLDAIYQLISFKWFYPGEALLVALFLAFIPYLLIRGPANRAARWWTSRRSSARPPDYGVTR